MTLQQRLQDDMKDAMRSRDAARLSVIRFIRSAVHNEEIERGSALEDDGVTDVLNRMAKQRGDSIDAFKKGNRQDLVDKEEAELAVVLGYLPQQLTEDEVAALAREAIQELGASGRRDMGKVMGRLIPQVRGMAQGNTVSAVVSRLLDDAGE